MGLHEVLLLALGMVLGMAALVVVRWMLLGAFRRRENENLVEELNRFGLQVKQFSERIADLSRSIENRSSVQSRTRSIEVMENLAEMNRLLRELNLFFAQRAEEDADDEDAAEFWASDFTSDDEQRKFEGLGQISADEIAEANWEDILDRLRRESEH